jgi:hypothetical protein
MEWNECGRIFEIGRAYGRLMYLIEEAEGTEDCDRLCDEGIPTIRTLLGYDEVGKGLIAASALNYVDGLLGFCAMHTIVDPDDDRISTATEWMEECVWACFGELLGYFREIDLTAREHEWVFRYSQGDPSIDSGGEDRVLLAVKDAEFMLNHDRKPESVMRVLSPLIEALARRFWPDDFQAHPRDRRWEVSGVLHRRLRDGPTESDRKFASVAISAYKQFRNPAQHDFEEFQCSEQEAGYFLSVVKVLHSYCPRTEPIGQH